MLNVPSGQETPILNGPAATADKLRHSQKPEIYLQFQILDENGDIQDASKASVLADAVAPSAERFTPHVLVNQCSPTTAEKKPTDDEILKAYNALLAAEYDEEDDDASFASESSCSSTPSLDEDPLSKSERGVAGAARLQPDPQPSQSNQGPIRRLRRRLSMGDGTTYRGPSPPRPSPRKRKEHLKIRRRDSNLVMKEAMDALSRSERSANGEAAPLVSEDHNYLFSHTQSTDRNPLSKSERDVAGAATGHHRRGSSGSLSRSNHGSCHRQLRRSSSMGDGSGSRPLATRKGGARSHRMQEDQKKIRKDSPVVKDALDALSRSGHRASGGSDAAGYRREGHPRCRSSLSNVSTCRGMPSPTSSRRKRSEEIPSSSSLSSDTDLLSRSECHVAGSPFGRRRSGGNRSPTKASKGTLSRSSHGSRRRPSRVDSSMANYESDEDFCSLVPEGNRGPHSPTYAPSLRPLRSSDKILEKTGWGGTRRAGPSELESRQQAQLHLDQVVSNSKCANTAVVNMKRELAELRIKMRSGFSH